MSRLELVKVETDTTKIYNPKDKFVFKLTFNNQELLEDDVEFEVLYFGDAYSDNHDQKLCHNVIGPLEAGKLCFELETSPIDLTKIPIKTLFGLTTILIVGKFKGEQFIRIGYVVDVRYPGIAAEKLIDNDDSGYEEEEEIEGEEDNCDECEQGDDEEVDEGYDDEEIELMDDDELDEEEGDDQEDNEDAQNEVEEGDEIDEDEGDDQEDDEEAAVQLEDALAESLMPGSKRKAIPLETSIVSGKDEFEYKGFTLKQSSIELTLLDKPIIHVFEIDWGTTANINQDEFVGSSEEDEIPDSFNNEEKGENNNKKVKLQ